MNRNVFRQWPYHPKEWYIMLDRIRGEPRKNYSIKQQIMWSRNIEEIILGVQIFVFESNTDPPNTSIQLSNIWNSNFKLFNTWTPKEKPRIVVSINTAFLLSSCEIPRGTWNDRVDTARRDFTCNMFGDRRCNCGYLGSVSRFSAAHFPATRNMES